MDFMLFEKFRFSMHFIIKTKTIKFEKSTINFSSLRSRRWNWRQKHKTKSGKTSNLNIAESLSGINIWKQKASEGKPRIRYTFPSGPSIQSNAGWHQSTQSVDLRWFTKSLLFWSPFILECRRGSILIWS